MTDFLQMADQSYQLFQSCIEQVEISKCSEKGQYTKNGLEIRLESISITICEMNTD